MTKQDFDNIYNYFLNLMSCGIEYNPIALSVSSFNQDDCGNKKELSEMLFGYVSDYFFGSKFIHVIPDEEFMSLGGKTLFHGFVDFDHGARELVHWKHHYGRGIMGGGLYTTTNIEEAYEYTISQSRFEKAGDYAKILPVKIIPELIKSVDFEFIGNLAMKIDENLDINDKDNDKVQEILRVNELIKNMPMSDEKFLFIQCIVMNPSILAVMLGYNYVVQKKTYNDVNNDIILDRGVIVAPKSISENFLKKSLEFKDDILNYQTMSEIKKLFGQEKEISLK